MSRIRGKLNLAALKSVVTEVTGKEGKKLKALIIPIEENHLFLSKQGSVYLDVICFESDKIPEFTHSVKQSLPKEIRDKMSKEEQNAMPFLGNLELMTPNADSGQTKSQDLPPAPNLTDLPF